MFRELFLNSKVLSFYYGDYNVSDSFYRHCVGVVAWLWAGTDTDLNSPGSYSYYMLGSPSSGYYACSLRLDTLLMGPMYVIKYVAAAVIAFAYLKRFVKNKVCGNRFSPLRLLRFQFTTYSLTSSKRL